MDLYQYLEFRKKLEENGKNLYDVIDLSESINESESSNNSEELYETNKALKAAGTVFAIMIQGFGYIFSKIGIGKYIGAKDIHRWGVKKAHVRYLKKKRQKFIKDLIGEKIDIDKEDEYLINPDSLRNNEDDDEKQSDGKIIVIINNFIKRKQNFFEYYGVESFEDLPNVEKKKIQELENKIMESLEKAIDELYELKTQEISKKINNSNMKESTKYALKYFWKILIVAIKPRIYSDLWELQILESKNVEDRIQEYKDKLQKSAKNTKDVINNKVGEKIEKEKILPQEEEIWVYVDEEKDLIKFKFESEKEDENGISQMHLLNLNKEEEVTMKKEDFLEKATPYPKKNQVWKYTDKEGIQSRYLIEDIEDDIVFLQSFSEEGDLENESESKELEIKILIKKGNIIKRKYNPNKESKGEASEPEIGEI